ncbi:MAG: hypothetical protein J7L38_03690 [Thermoproteales archaeon]|nr:hypothetical protein [Thermoproteales archaeon]
MSVVVSLYGGRGRHPAVTPLKAPLVRYGGGDCEPVQGGAGGEILPPERNG